jgi:hypothetical protein
MLGLDWWQISLIGFFAPKLRKTIDLFAFAGVGAFAIGLTGEIWGVKMVCAHKYEAYAVGALFLIIWLGYGANEA